MTPISAPRIRKALLLFAAAVLLGALLLPSRAPVSAAGKDSKPAAAKPGMETKDFEDWRLQCAKTPQGGRANCRIYQRIVLQQGKAPVLAAFVIIAKINDKPVPVMKVVTPLGVDLSAGVAMKVDEEKQVNLPYQVCLPGGCIARLAPDSDFLGKLRHGQKFLAGFRRAQVAQTSTFSLSLKGFGKALAALAGKDAGG
jgi:invasion protein IalB